MESQYQKFKMRYFDIFLLLIMNGYVTILNMKYYGDYHTHTRVSDGHSTLEENVISAIGAGLSELACTDHGFNNPSLYSLSRPKFRRQRNEIEKLREKYAGKLHIYHGVEADIIGVDGTIDLKENELSEMDVIIVGYHTYARPKSFRDWQYLFFNAQVRPLVYPSRETINRNTRSLINSIRRYPVDIVGHVNHLLKVNVYEVAKAASDYGSFIELNEKHVNSISHDAFEKMLSTDVKFIINSDAHHFENIGRFPKVEKFLSYHNIDEERIVNLITKPQFNRNK